MNSIQSNVYVKRYVREFPCIFCHKPIKIVENHLINLKTETCGCGTFRIKIQKE